MSGFGYGSPNYQSFEGGDRNWSPRNRGGNRHQSPRQSTPYFYQDRPRGPRFSPYGQQQQQRFYSPHGQGGYRGGSPYTPRQHYGSPRFSPGGGFRGRGRGRGHNNSFGDQGIDAWISPEMWSDPWEELRGPLKHPLEEEGCANLEDTSIPGCAPNLEAEVDTVNIPSTGVDTADAEVVTEVEQSSDSEPTDTVAVTTEV